MMLAKARKAKEEKLKQEGALQQAAATGAGATAKKERVSKWGAKAGGATDWWTLKLIFFHNWPVTARDLRLGKFEIYWKQRVQ